MASSTQPHHHDSDPEDDADMFDPADADEIVADDEDAHMESDDDEADPSATLEEIQLQNDSAAHFDGHKDSIFSIANHPIHPEIVATGGGDDIGFVFDSTPPPAPLLPQSYESNPQPIEREGIKPLYKLEGHTDSLSAITFTLPNGEYLVSAGLDGRLRSWRGDSSARQWTFLAEAQEVEEINWLAPCPHPSYPNTVAFGAGDGSVWIYTVDAADKASPLTIVQTFYQHTASCTAGAWSPDGKLLATVCEDANLYVWDPFGEAAAAGITQAQGGQSVVALTGQDERFRVEGGLYSVAIAPNGAFVAVGGAGGHVRVVGLPKLSTDGSAVQGSRGGGARNKAGGGKQGGSSAAGQAGQILASLQGGAESVETIAFSHPPLTLMATGSVDGSITLYDSAHRFAARRTISGAHEDEEGQQAVIKLEFVKTSGPGSWLLTSCGNDGVVRRWDARGGTAAAAKGLVGEWRGHRGNGEGGGILGFVHGEGGKWVVTAGDDSISLVFNTPVA